MPQESASPLECLSLEFDNFDDFNRSVRGWNAAFSQVEEGLATVRLRHRMSPQINALDVSFSHSTASFGSTQRGHRTFGMVDIGTGCSWCRQDVDASQILRFDAHEEFETYTPSGFMGRTLSVDESLIEEIASQLQFTGFLERLAGAEDVLTVSPAAATGLRNLFDRDHRSEQSLRTVVEQFMVLLETDVIPVGGPRQKHTSRLVDNALSYIVANAEEAPTVAELCAQLGVGYRMLDRAFKERLGHGPKSCILAFRLHKVREAVCASDRDMKIVDIANHWGFWHQGDFARNYRRVFGELPSDTRRLRQQA